MSLDISLYTKECNHCGNGVNVFNANITHNLNRMAGVAGIYQHVWRPEELGIIQAKDLIEPLRNGLQKLKNNPIYYKQYESPNGWGLYDNFVPWLEKYL